MLRIKEAIQRRRMIQEMTDDWYEEEILPLPQLLSLPSRKFSIPEQPGNEDTLAYFAQGLSARMSKLQKRALRITWKRLSEAPRTSGRGMIAIMEKVFEKMNDAMDIMPIFYKSAFLSCVEDKRRGASTHSRTITTVRDHAHLLIDFIDDLLDLMFDIPLEHKSLDIATIGRIHAKLEPMGFHRSLWNFFGESFAEVMFNQECVRAYPHAPSAWSMLSIVTTNALDAASRIPKGALQARSKCASRNSSLSDFKRTARIAIMHPILPGINEEQPDLKKKKGGNVFKCCKSRQF
ncbi:unnamed protein product [Dracunculus medinensis]|uniref:GLOBIN domain-containing protein n=1 Tax=Dracunculus medinensis TaxID=318479 RepID=A0A0N4UI17_DRAME|nr:unnamed protein product [Dracunculus medinensis]